jgi:hypothetical protein
VVIEDSTGCRSFVKVWHKESDWLEQACCESRAMDCDSDGVKVLWAGYPRSAAKERVTTVSGQRVRNGSLAAWRRRHR